MPDESLRRVTIRWDDPDVTHVPLLKQGGVEVVVLSASHEPFTAACETAGIRTIAASEMKGVDVAGLEGAQGINVVLTNGLWPGVTRPPSVAGRGDETASASREPWVDANGYWIPYLRALYPQRPAVLGYLPQLGDRGVPFDTLELAFIEAQVPGGNYILSVQPAFRKALLARDPKATDAWNQLGRTAKWFRNYATWFGQPCPATVTALVEPGAATAEITNLLFRRNVSPRLWAASAPPDPDARTCRTLVAANLRPPSPEIAAGILAHAEAGSTVVVATPRDQQWWRKPGLKSLRSEPDREFFSLGRGQLVAYRQRIADPSEFALDVIDLVTHKNRPVRLWNAPAVIALSTASPHPAGRLVHLINYGRFIDSELQVRVQGEYARAMLHRPDAPARSLKPARRGTTTEVFVPELRRLGVLVFS